MKNYTHILLAVDFSDHTDAIAERARDLADKYEAKISLLHVVDNLPIVDTVNGPIIPYEIDLTEQLMESAKLRLEKLAERFNIPENNRFLELGSPKIEIVRIAEENSVDLIVVGSHGRHGLALLLGSTANGVLHHAKCDVLAVRIKDE